MYMNEQHECPTAEPLGVDGEVLLNTVKDNEIPPELKPRTTYKGKPLRYSPNGFVKTYCVRHDN